jgi:UDP-glucuronate 4-epimerase
VTYLLTGAAGFIGFHVAAALAERGDEVVCIDSINDYYDPALKYARLRELGIGSTAAAFGLAIRSAAKPSLSFIRTRLDDRDALGAVFRRRRFDRVIHLAAQAGVRYSLENPYAYLDSNLAGFLNVLESCRASGTGHLVYASSSSVYGLNSRRPFRSADRTDHPVSLYAATKKANEAMAHAYAHLYGLPATGLRFFTVYGPWGRPDMAYFKFAQAIASGNPIDVYNGGDMYRDFTYVSDIVEGILRVADRPPAADPGWTSDGSDPAASSAPHRIYNIGNSRPERLRDFIALLEDALGMRAEKRFLPMQAGDVYATEADVSDLERDFGWRPTMPAAEGIARFAAWFAKYRRSAGER